MFVVVQSRVSAIFRSQSAVSALADEWVPPGSLRTCQSGSGYCRLSTDAVARSLVKMVVGAEALTLFFGQIAWLLLAPASVVVGRRAIGADFAGEFERTIAIADVGVPVPVWPENGAVLNIRARFCDAFTAFRIEGGAWRAAVGA